MTNTPKIASFATITQNALWIAGSHFLNGLVQFSFFLCILHLAPQSHTDLFELGRSCLEIGVGILGSGMAAIIIRENARNHDWWIANSPVVRALLRRAALTLGSTIFLLVSIASHTRLHFAVVGLFCLAIYFQSRSDLYEAAFRSRDQVKIPVWIGIACNLIITLLTLAAAYCFPYPILWAAGGVLLRWAVQGSLLSRRIPRREATTVSIQQLGFRELLQDLTPIGIGIMAFILYARIDVLMLHWMGFGHTIATYGCAFRPIGFLSMFVAAFYQAFAPSMSRMIHQNPANAWKTSLRIGGTFFLLGLVAAIGIVYFRETITSSLYPESYRLASEGLRVMAWSLPIVFGGNAVGFYLINYGKRGVRSYMAVNLIGVLFNIAGNGFAIPSYSFIGAAWTTVLTDALTTLLMAAACRTLSTASSPLNR